MAALFAFFLQWFCFGCEFPVFGTVPVKSAGAEAFHQNVIHDSMFAELFQPEAVGGASLESCQVLSDVIRINSNAFECLSSCPLQSLYIVVVQHCIHKSAICKHGCYCTPATFQRGYLALLGLLVARQDCFGQLR
jgi:hypothetical protein